MIAINLLDNQPIEVEQYKKCFYQKLPLQKNGRPFLNLTHRILYPSQKNISAIEDGLKYCYYTIEGKLYQSVLTSDIKSKDSPFNLMDELSSIKIKQLSMFDDEEIEDDEEDEEEDE